MSRLDIVIFGATGFTGKQTAIHMVEYAKKHNITAWGIAGRSEKKLQDVLAEVAKKTGADVSSVKTIIADVGDEKSLHEMCAQTKVLVNCCGPYMLYGEPVVKAAVNEKTHYVDVSGEPQFMEKMQLRYNDEAREAGVFIVSACGWDSVPADMGVTVLKQNFKGTLNSVESYLSFKVPKEYAEKSKERGLINYGTWESLVGGLSRHHELPALRKQLYPQRLPTFKPKLHRQLLHKKEGSWYLPFLGADESVIYRTQRYLYEIEHQRPIHFKTYFKSGGLLQSFLFIFFGIILYGMAKFQWSRSLLLNYPRWFSWGAVSKEGPTDEVMENSFFKFKLFGSGWETGADVDNTKPDKNVVVEVTGSNPGYGATVVTLLTSACTILKERQKMPAGGVLTPGAAFKDTDMVKNLNETKYIKFQVVENK